MAGTRTAPAPGQIEIGKSAIALYPIFRQANLVEVDVLADFGDLVPPLGGGGKVA
jgi:hypothetical protein